MIDIENRKNFNESLGNIVKDDCNLTEFCEAMRKAGKLTLEDEENDNPGWYEENKEMLRPFFDEKNKLLFEARNTNSDDDSLKMRCRDARKNARNAIQIAKTLWVEKIAEIAHNMNFSPKVA